MAVEPVTVPMQTLLHTVLPSPFAEIGNGRGDGACAYDGTSNEAGLGSCCLPRKSLARQKTFVSDWRKRSPRPGALRKTGEEKMENRWDLLVVSGRFENKKALLHILYDLPVFVFTASTV